MRHRQCKQERDGRNTPPPVYGENGSIHNGSSRNLQPLLYHSGPGMTRRDRLER